MAKEKCEVEKVSKERIMEVLWKRSTCDLGSYDNFDRIIILIRIGVR